MEDFVELMESVSTNLQTSFSLVMVAVFKMDISIRGIEGLPDVSFIHRNRILGITPENVIKAVFKFLHIFFI